MSHLRLNPATGDWVVIASERDKRPENTSRHPYLDDQADHHRENCPFCPKKVEETPVFRFTDDEGRWTLRVLANRYPAVAPGERPTPNQDLFQRHMAGTGHHDVVVEHRLHNFRLAREPSSALGPVLSAWKRRYRELAKLPDTKHVVVFKNHGARAGASMEHPHSQIVSLPVLPSQVRYRLETAMHVSNTLGNCVFCSMLAHELESMDRVLQRSKHFTAFVPYAAFSPYSVWIMPHRHSCDFASVTEAELADLSQTLHWVLSRVYHGLGDPDYNLVVRSALPSTVGEDYFHWYISIIPRLGKAAGFEMGSGMFINSSLPEADAAYLRKLKIDP
jgi:UDPglucose--hexose-1-phosphate uridylyltransferase